MSGPCLVGIDLGTQSAKVEVLDAGGAVVASATRSLRPTVQPYPGAVEHPGDDLWDALGAAVREALAGYDAAGGAREELAAAGLCGIRNCRAVVAADGTLVHPVLSWMDERVGRAHEPFPGQRWVTASSGYLTMRLTGEARDSVAAYRGLWPSDLRSRGWSDDPEVLAACGTPPEVLVDLVEPGDVLGAVTAAAAAHTGLPAGLPVVATANDKGVEALGAGLADPDDVLVSLGTYVAAMAMGEGPGEAPADDAAHSWTNFASVPGRYLRESAGIRRGMWTVSWVRDLVGDGVGGDVEDLDARAAAVPRGSDGLLTVLDWLPPVDQPHRRGAFVGLDARHGPAHLHRSVLEALAMTMRTHVDAMLDELGRPPGRLLLSGGGSRSALSRQVAADVFARPVVVPGGGSPAARGAAICAAVGAGVHPCFDAARTAMVPAGETTLPDPEAVPFFAELRTIHRELPASLDPVLRRLHALTG